MFLLKVRLIRADTASVPRPSRALLVVVAALVALPLSSLSPAPDAEAGTRRRLAKLEPAAGVYFGAYHSPRGPIGIQSRKDGITALESAVGRRFDVDHQFYRWGQMLPSAYDVWTAEQGRTPMISLHPRKKADGSVTTWGAIASGAEDAYLQQVAASLKAWGKPAFFVFHHEPESELCPNNTLTGCDLGTYYGTTSQYKQAWRRVKSVLRKAGNTQLAMTFVTTSYRFRTDPLTDPKYGAKFYPGDDVIDWIGADPYNFIGAGTTPEQLNAAWRGLADEIGPWYAWAAQRNKPLALAEIGVREDPNAPGRKGQWIDQARLDLPTRFPKVKAFVYFDSYPGEAVGDGMNWRVDSSPEAFASYRAMAHDPVYRVASSLFLPDPPS